MPAVLWANRTTPRTATGQTPLSLVYGCEAVLPVKASIPTTRTCGMNEHHKSEELCQDVDSLEELHENASLRMASHQQTVMRNFKKKVKSRVFLDGDYVLRKVFPNTKETNACKLAPTWEGPYLVTCITGNGAYRLQDMEGRDVQQSWNALHLKKYFF